MIDYINKDLFWQDSLKKSLTLTFSDGDVVTNSDLESEQLNIIEALNTDQDIVFGSVNASEISFPLHNIFRQKVGCTFTVDMVLGTDTANPFRFGTYKVQSDIPTADRTKREIRAYDALYEVINADVAAWYNTILPNSTTTVTLAQFRHSFASYFNLTEVTQTLVNDSMTVKRTIDPNTLSGRDVLFAIGEINGAFAHMTRDNKLKYYTIPQSIEGLYPATDLYPSPDLFPQKPKGEIVTKSNYIPPLQYEDWKVPSITRIQIRQESGDIGTTYGTVGSDYIITGNFLTYGKNASELTVIATNLLGQIKDIIYRPFKVAAKSNPCLEVGDVIRMNTSANKVESYILQRTIHGIQGLRDELSADGSVERTEKVNSIASQFKALSGKVTTIKADTDGIETRVEDIENGSASIIQQLDNQISSKVSANGVISAINQTAEQISIDASKINLTGYVSINGGFQIDQFGNAFLQNNDYTSRLSSDGFKVTSNSGEGTYFSNSVIAFETLTSIENFVNVTWSGNTGIISMPHISSINGGTPITSSNIGSQSVSSASYASTADYSNRLMDVNNAFGCRPSTWSSQACVIPYRDSGSDGDVNLGWSSRRWKDIYATNGTIQTSDARQKKNIAELTEAHIRFIKAIVPRSFQFITGESGRTHIGFVAQEIQQAMTECGLTDLDFAGFIKSPVVALDEEGNPTDEVIDYVYGLRYEEFIALLTYAWQYTDKKLDNLITTLENQGII